MADTPPEQPGPSQENTPTCPKAEICTECHREIPWLWSPAIFVGGRQIDGTGVHVNPLVDGLCAECTDATEKKREAAQRAEEKKQKLIRVLGGERPYREFTFEQFRVERGNKPAFECATAFNPRKDNLYLWGACGVGKTHLLYAIARKNVEADRSVVVFRPHQLMRRLRGRQPDEEQEIINELSAADVFVLDELGAGADTAFARQIFQEILDARNYSYRAGLVVAGKYSPDQLADKLGDDTIPSRLTGMCRVIHVTGNDHRIERGK